MNYHLTNFQFLMSGFALILAILLVLAAIHQLRPKKTPPFRNYFYSYSYSDSDSEPEGDLLQQSAFSDPEEWRAGQLPLIDDFNTNDAIERLMRVRESTRQNLNSE